MKYTQLRTAVLTWLFIMLIPILARAQTSKGVVVDRVARRENMGGEVLAFVW